MLRPYYREFELAWSFPQEDAERFRKILLVMLLLFLLLGILIPLLPVPQREKSTAEDVPPRLAKLMLEKKPPPPPPPKKEEPKPEVKKEPKPEPKPVDRQQEARKKAQVALMPFKDELADLRDNRMVDIAVANRPLTDAARAGDVTQRSLITSKVGQGSGGINTSSLSRGFGGGGFFSSISLASRGGTSSAVDSSRCGTGNSGIRIPSSRKRRSMASRIFRKRSASSCGKLQASSNSR